MSARRPVVTLKGAMTLDGRIATRTGDSKWISSIAARREAHRLRAQNDAVLVGVQTVLRDDPELTVRHLRGKNPLRVVLDSRLRTPIGSQVASVGPGRRTLIVHGPRAPKRKRACLIAAGVELLEVRADRQGRPKIDHMLRELRRRGVAKLLVEGGAQVHGALLDAGAVDRFELALAPMLLVDAEALSLTRGRARERIREALPLRITRVRRLGPDVLIEGIVLGRRPAGVS